MKIFLATPPFTQLNTPYPATAYLKGFLNTRGISSRQADLGIDVILKIFSREGLSRLFEGDLDTEMMSDNAFRIYKLRNAYRDVIDPVIAFLQDKDPSLAYLIVSGNFLPMASRFDETADLEYAFGNMGLRDRARHLVTLMLEDLSDFIIETRDELFGFSRYGEKLGRSAGSFDTLYNTLQGEPSFTDHFLFEALDDYFKEDHYDMAALSVPFPGNLYSAFRTAEWIRKHRPGVKVCLGGGFVNTELRSLSDSRVFEYFDFVTLDDGEAPIEHLTEYLQGRRHPEFLKRTFALQDGKIRYFNGSFAPDYKQKDVGCPDYEGLPIYNYLSVIEVANPMHRLWSDGRWNKLTLAHGCYWGKCTFCDISLDYIGNYEFTTAAMLVDRMETLIRQTGQRGFHFVDEAAPPALMREVALEILRRKLSITWWTNIRFEKSFSADLCRLLALSGCIAVSGGLEVASDRLLKLIDKGVTIEQVARVTHHFTQAGIMVHAYLMYGYPTQNEQETIDSMEVVRQLLETGVVQSGFWHQFALTAHSPVGRNPAAYGLQLLTTEVGSFANNDLEYTDLSGCDHGAFSEGLKRSLFNYMNGLCLDRPLGEWFDFEVPETTIDPDLIRNYITSEETTGMRPNKRLVYTGVQPEMIPGRKGRSILLFESRNASAELEIKSDLAQWLSEALDRCRPEEPAMTLGAFEEKYKEAGFLLFNEFWQGKEMKELREFGLLVI